MFTKQKVLCRVNRINEPSLFSFHLGGREGWVGVVGGGGCSQSFFALWLRLLTFWRTTATVVEKFPRKRTRKQRPHTET